jgi:hypothetical protein
MHLEHSRLQEANMPLSQAGERMFAATQCRPCRIRASYHSLYVELVASHSNVNACQSTFTVNSEHEWRTENANPIIQEHTIECLRCFINKYVALLVAEAFINHEQEITTPQHETVNNMSVIEVPSQGSLHGWPRMCGSIGRTPLT